MYGSEDRVMNGSEEHGEIRDTIRIYEAMVLGKLVTLTEQEEDIDKVTAQYYLDSRYVHQRAITKAVVDRMVQAMNSDEFIEPLGGTIIISDTGKLMNGQHRLTAVTHTDKTIRFTVQRGLPEEAFVYIDQNKTRSLKDTFQIDGIRNAKAVASAANLLYQLVEEKKANPRNEVALRMVQDHPRLVDSVTFAVSMAATTHIPVPVGAVMHFLYFPKYAKEYAEAFELLKFGDRKIMSNGRHPLVKLQKKLNEAWAPYRNFQSMAISAGLSFGYSSHYLMLSWIHQALYAYIVQGKETFRWTPDSDVESVITSISKTARHQVHIRHDYRSEINELTGGSDE